MGNCQSQLPQRHCRRDTQFGESSCASSLGHTSAITSPNRKSPAPHTPCSSCLGSPVPSELCFETHNEGGHTLVGHYEICDNVVIGEGKYSSVHACMDCHDETHAENIAAKVVTKSDATPQQLFRLQKEIRLLSQIRHKYIAQFVHAYETPQHVYLLMGRVNGGSGLSVLKALKDHKLDEKRARRYFAQLVEAVGHLHQHGIVHRDLKLENILYRETDDAFVLADFGFATEIGADHMVHTSCGTVCYAAPELFASGTYDGCAADGWALGIILHALVAGGLPFDSPDDEETIAQIQRETYVPPKCVSSQLGQLLCAMLEKDPKRRPDIAQIERHPWLTKKSK